MQAHYFLYFWLINSATSVFSPEKQLTKNNVFILQLHPRLEWERREGSKRPHLL
jgi:hypothetical protein